MMRKLLTMMLALAIALSLFVMPAAAYIERGTVHISADQDAVELKTGETTTVAITLDPAQDDQMPGCGMADCPETCGENCLSKDGNCTCDITSYETYYTEVPIKIDAPEVVEATYENGVLTLKGLAAGTTNVNVAARLREYTGSSVDIQVTVTKSGPSVALIAGAIVGLALVAGIVVALGKKGKKYA